MLYIIIFFWIVNKSYLSNGTLYNDEKSKKIKDFFIETILNHRSDDIRKDKILLSEKDKEESYKEINDVYLDKTNIFKKKNTEKARKFIINLKKNAEKYKEIHGVYPDNYLRYRENRNKARNKYYRKLMEDSKKYKEIHGVFPENYLKYQEAKRKATLKFRNKKRNNIA